jgi:lipoprotein-anchoring transpeptidase ErfK/SrfK
MKSKEKTMQTIRVLAILAAAAAEVLGEDPNRRLIVSIPDRKIVLMIDGRVAKVYPVAVGKRSTPSPTGNFHIASRVRKPAWYQPGKVVGPGPANPLGTRWMGLGYKGYGIHGTNMPNSIGKAASHGCIRMRIHDVEELFELVQLGDPVELVDEPSADLAKTLGESSSETVGSGASGDLQ